jgi:LEA14-like dessication related protein
MAVQRMTPPIRSLLAARMRPPPITIADLSRRTAIVGCALVLAACAALAPRPLPPRIEFVGVRIARLQLTDVRLRVALDVHNPNAYELSVASIDAEITVNGVRLAAASLPSSLALPAAATSRVELDLRTGVDKLVGVLDRLPASGPVPYEITGIAVVQDGVRLPFRRRGELPVAEWLPGARR